MNAWEFHPSLVHFPLAFLLGGVALDFVARRNQNPILPRAAGGLFLAGLVLLYLSAGTGLLAFYTAPHNEEAHRLMYWHAGIALASAGLFTWIGILRWRARREPARRWNLSLEVAASALILVAAYVGGHLVYHLGTGVVEPTAEGAASSPSHP